MNKTHGKCTQKYKRNLAESDSENEITEFPKSVVNGSLWRKSEGTIYLEWQIAKKNMSRCQVLTRETTENITWTLYLIHCGSVMV